MRYVSTSNLMRPLVDAIHETRPPVFVAPIIDAPGDGVSVVTVTFALTPELVKAWGDKCAQAGDGRSPPPPAPEPVEY